MLGTGNKVVEHVLLPGQVSRPMPLLPVLASTSEVGDGYDSSLVKPDSPSNPEIWLQANPVATVPAENCRVTTIQSHPLTPDNVERNTGPVSRSGELADNFAIIKVLR